MKLSVSNIAWDPARMDEFLGLLQSQGCQGLEFSASMLWQEPVEADVSKISDFKKKVWSFGLEFSSMHSLTYTRPDLTFFDSDGKRKDLVEYIISLGRIANLLEIPVMVFGSAKSRQIGSGDRDECLKVMADTFYRIAEGLKPLGVILLIEPLSKIESDCINNTEEAVSIVKSVSHSNFSLHVDLRSSFAEKEDYSKVWSKYSKIIRHCHVANPGLNPPGPDCPEHYKAAEAIRISGYGGYISLETRKVSSPGILRDAIKFVKEVYLN